MNHQMIYHIDAEKDIIQAKNWYKQQQVGLEKRFALAVKEAINYIIDNPLLFEVKYKNTRIAFTSIFPFGIHYHFDENKNTITILTVLRTSKNPNF